MHTYYLHEDTALKHDAKQYWLSRPSLFAIMIDSLDEVLQDARENERSQLIAQVEYVIEQFVSENNGFVTRRSRQVLRGDRGTLHEGDCGKALCAA